ncbi:MAG: hypothetical protein MK198_14040 [Gracilimonas sp.]|uniref:hypothetical protein n=1 Tax=Gracilimonas sp. TaxID=1974203 RepID=UPI0037501C1B|nr:hypothetical protein [Gracilimonas sp.]
MQKIILKKEESIEQLKEKLRLVSKRSKGLDAKKYSGIIKVNEDPMEYQKRIRAEWDESAS